MKATKLMRTLTKSIAHLWQRLYRHILFAKAGRGQQTASTPLMKSRPTSLSMNYILMDDQGRVDELFLRMRRYLYQSTEQLAHRDPKRVMVLREAGRVAPNRPYFYLKSLNQRGWLFERSGSGWVVSRAEKIVSQDTFIRSHEAWDTVNIFTAADGESLPRVSSPRLGAELVSFAVYEEMLLQHLDFGELGSS